MRFVVIILLSMYIVVLDAKASLSNFERLCDDDHSIQDTTFTFPSSAQETEQRSSSSSSSYHIDSISSPRGHVISYTYSTLHESSDCVIVAAPSLSGHATHTTQWLDSMSRKTKCQVSALEYRGFGLSKHKSTDSNNKTGMKIASLASDFNELVKRFEHKKNIFLLGLSAGSNVLWSWLQLYYHTTADDMKNIKGILPLEGALLATPQYRGAAVSFQSSSTATFSWKELQSMTDRFLSASSPEVCFEELYTFFTQTGFFSSLDLAEQYLRATCNLDCVAFGLLNKDSLFADYTDVVIQNAEHFKIPVFVFVAEGSLVPHTTQNFIAKHSVTIPDSVQWSLSASNGGVHFALMPGELGYESLVDAMSQFVLSLLQKKDSIAMRRDEREF